jgi:hypothetical protein
VSFPNEQTNLRFVILLDFVGGICQSGFEIQVQCSYAAAAVGKTELKGSAFCEVSGRGIAVGKTELQGIAFCEVSGRGIAVGQTELKGSVFCEVSGRGIAVGKTELKGSVFCEVSGRGILGYFCFSVGVPVKKRLSSWITCIFWFSFFFGQQTCSRKTLNYAIAVEVKVEAVTVE